MRRNPVDTIVTLCAGVFWLEKASFYCREKAVLWWKHVREQRPGAVRLTDISWSPLKGSDCPQAKQQGGANWIRQTRGDGKSSQTPRKRLLVWCLDVQAYTWVYLHIYGNIVRFLCVWRNVTERQVWQANAPPPPPPSLVKQCSVRSQTLKPQPH